MSGFKIDRSLKRDVVELEQLGYKENQRILWHELPVARPDLASVDELAVLDGNKCILQLRHVRPFLSDKYDLTQHPNYHLTSGADKKNIFDIEAFLNRRLKLKPNDVYEIINEDEISG